MISPINPLEHQLHLKQVEREFFNSGYDHSGAPLTGWRAEREYCHINAQAAKEPGNGCLKSTKKKETFFEISWVAKIVGISKSMLQFRHSKANHN